MSTILLDISTICQHKTAKLRVAKPYHKCYKSSMFGAGIRGIGAQHPCPGCDGRCSKGLWVGEWPGGIAPPGSLRTVREPLDSYGSSYRAAIPRVAQWARRVLCRQATRWTHLVA